MFIVRFYVYVSMVTTLTLVSAFTAFSSGTTSLKHWTNIKSTTKAVTTGISISSSSTTMLYLQQSVQDAIIEAERICAIDPTSNECKVAWDIVEELEAADSHRGYQPVNSGVGMDGNNNIAGETTDVDAFLSSLDILTRKIDGKMDQLKGTSYKLQELGANDPSIAELAYQADAMKQAIVNARAWLSGN